jgi:hypothetical protein
VTAEDVITVVGRLPDKSSAADPIPTAVLKNVVDLVAPYIAELFSRSLAAGQFPVSFKHAFVTPIVKKAGMDTSQVGSYRPISNLSVLSKMLERVVAKQLTDYLEHFQLFPSSQSGFRRGHSTETATLHVISELLDAVDRGDYAALVLLDLTAAFDTVDHDILLERLRRSFGIKDKVLSWFASYLIGRTQCVRVGAATSSTTTLECSVPQGSVLGPILFVLYTVDLPSVIQRHRLAPHLYADDTQIYGHCRPSDVDRFSTSVSDCVSDVAAWMCSNRLHLNTDKTELLWCASPRQQHRLPSVSMSVAGCDVIPSKSVRDLGVFIDSDLTFRSHIDVIVSRCFAALRRLRAIRRYVSVPTLRTLVTSLVLSRLDYCNSVLVGLPACQLHRLQAVQNAAARFVFNIRRSEHITDALICLHWLRVPERIRFKMAVLVYKSLHGQLPSYFATFQPLSAGRERRGLRSDTSHHLCVPRRRLITVGDRSFPVAGANIWNDLPADVASSPTLSTFRSRLKTFLFTVSYPGAVV